MLIGNEDKKILEQMKKKRKMVDDKNYGIQRDGICLK